MVWLACAQKKSASGGSWPGRAGALRARRGADCPPGKGRRRHLSRLPPAGPGRTGSRQRELHSGRVARPIKGKSLFLETREMKCDPFFFFKHRLQIDERRRARLGSETNPPPPLPPLPPLPPPPPPTQKIPRLCGSFFARGDGRQAA